MIGFVLLVVPALFVVAHIVKRRIGTRDRRAGLQAEAPTFQVEPPQRSLYSREDYRL